MYTLGTNGYQLAGGGSAGHLKIFNVDPSQDRADEDGILGAPYLSFAAHQRWISECSFMSQFPNQLLTLSVCGPFPHQS